RFAARPAMIAKMITPMNAIPQVTTDAMVPRIAKFRASVAWSFWNSLLSLPMTQKMSGPMRPSRIMLRCASIAWVRSSGVLGIAAAGEGVSVICFHHFELDWVLCGLPPSREPKACQTAVDSNDGNHPLRQCTDKAHQWHEDANECGEQECKERGRGEVCRLCRLTCRETIRPSRREE